MEFSLMHPVQHRVAQLRKTTLDETAPEKPAPGKRTEGIVLAQ